MRTLVLDTFGPAASLAIVALTCLAIAAVLLAAVLRVLVHRRAAEEASRVAGGSTILRPGRRIVRGTVATEDGQPAFAIRIWQRGFEMRARGGKRHQWKERERAVTARGFELLLEDGTRVRVEPDEHAFLVDDLELVERSGPTERVMEARLVPGERVFVEGELSRRRGLGPEGGSYRAGVSEVWTMRPPSAGRMLLCTESLEARHKRRQRYWSRFALAVAIALGVTGFAGYELYGRLRIHGVTCNAEITGKRHYTTRRRRGGTSHHYAIAGVVHACQGLEGREIPVGDQVSSNVFSAISEGDVVPFVLDRRDPGYHQLGSQAGLEHWVVLHGGAIAFFLALIAWVTYSRSLEWYERKKVVHEGRGPL
ncbi:MAG: hypothetical protein OHK0013_48430 [Sandaracinaceae bacterium]